MGEFDLDPRIEGVAGFGWEAHFRGGVGQADIVRLTDTDSGCCVYPCDPASGGVASCDGSSCFDTCGFTCGAVTGRPCAC